MYPYGTYGHHAGLVSTTHDLLIIYKEINDFESKNQVSKVTFHGHKRFSSFTSVLNIQKRDLVDCKLHFCLSMFGGTYNI